MEKERGPKMEGRRVGGRGRTKARERGESWEGVANGIDGRERDSWRRQAGIGRPSARG